MNNINKEEFSSDKKRSFGLLCKGSRASDFTHFLDKIPSIIEFQKIEHDSGKNIKGVIFDIDGTLVAPYTEIYESVIQQLLAYKSAGKEVIVYTNSPYSSRLDIFTKNGIEIAQTDISKPSVQGFQEVCEQIGVQPENTAMIGNFAITDCPLVGNGKKPYFPINILVKSITPSFHNLERKLDENNIKLAKIYCTALLFHIMNLGAAKVVLFRNKNIKKEA